MDLQIKSYQLAREICHITKSEKLFDVIQKIIFDICQNKVGISPTKSQDATYIEYSISEQFNAIIKLRINENEPTEIVIWDILHEYGHFLSGKPDKTTIKREIEAWNKAYVILKDYSELISLEDSFFTYQEFCLKTYYIKKQKA